VIGKRHGYGSDNFAPHDLSLAVIGTGLLWPAGSADSRAIPRNLSVPKVKGRTVSAAQCMGIRLIPNLCLNNMQA
jgi:hypothetical protein